MQTDQGNLTTVWPPMNVWRIEKGLARTEYIEADCELVINGVLYQFIMKIDETDVIGSGRHWTVNPCKCETKEGSVIKAAFAIKEEECLLCWNPFKNPLNGVYMKVSETYGDGSVTLPDGSRFNGNLVLPDTISKWQGPSNPKLFIVNKVIAYGNVA